MSSAPQTATILDGMCKGFFSKRIFLFVLPLSLSIIHYPSSIILSFAQEEGILFLARFDDSTQEEISGKAGTSSGIGFDEGRVNQGIFFDGRDYLYYPAEGLIHPQKGTVEFWYQPAKDWSSTQDAQATLFVYDVNDQKRAWWEEWIAVYGGAAPGEKTQLVAEIGGEAAVKDQLIDESSRGWKAREWHHIAIVWSKDYFRLFTDGVLRAEKAKPFALTGPRDTIFVGNDVGLEYGIGERTESASAEGTIDELAIWDYPKNPWEIEAAAKNPGNPASSVLGKNPDVPPAEELPQKDILPAEKIQALKSFLAQVKEKSKTIALGLILGGAAALTAFGFLRLWKKPKI